MVAIPVKLNTPNTPIAPLFGKSKWFAFVDKDGGVEFWRNDVQSGREIVNYFHEKRVETVIFQQMGGNPFMLLQRNDIACQYAGDGRVLLPSVLEAFNAGNLLHVNLENMHEFVEKSKMHAKGGHHHGAHQYHADSHHHSHHHHAH